MSACPPRVPLPAARGPRGRGAGRGRPRFVATFLTRPSNDKFQAGRHHPYMGEFERVNRFLFDRRMPFLHLVVSHRVPRAFHETRGVSFRWRLHFPTKKVDPASL